MPAIGIANGSERVARSRMLSGALAIARGGETVVKHRQTFELLILQRSIYHRSEVVYEV